MGDEDRDPRPWRHADDNERLERGCRRAVDDAVAVGCGILMATVIVWNVRRRGA